MKKWACQRSNECCTRPARVTVSVDEARLMTNLADRAPRPVRFIRRHDGFLNLVAGPCPFFDDGCAIYDNRPYNCRRFQCGRWDAKSEPWMPDPMPAIVADKKLRRSYDLNQNAAQVWAIAHGWMP